MEIFYSVNHYLWPNWKGQEKYSRTRGWSRLRDQTLAVKSRKNNQKSGALAQAAVRAPPEVALQCVAGHCYYQLLVFLSLSVYCF